MQFLVSFYVTVSITFSIIISAKFYAIFLGKQPSWYQTFANKVYGNDNSIHNSMDKLISEMNDPSSKLNNPSSKLVFIICCITKKDFSFNPDGNAKSRLMNFSFFSLKTICFKRALNFATIQNSRECDNFLES